MKLTFEVNNQTLIRTDKSEVVASSKNYLYAEFSFLTEEWEDVPKTAIFTYQNKKSLAILDENNTCLVPWEVLKGGFVFVSVFGGNLITTNNASINVMWSGYVEGETPSSPTPDVYTQILERINTLEVGEVSDERIAEVVSEYLAENPIDGVNSAEVERIVAEYINAHKEELKGEKGDPGEDASGSVSDEAIAEAVAEYLEENPINVATGTSVSKWNNKTLCAFGTSITARCNNGGGYLKVLQDTLGLASYTNNGLDGNAIAYVNGRAGISRKIQSTDITEFDIITIEGCTNDFKLNVPVGEVGAMGDSDFDDGADFCQALRKAIESILTSNPKANILLIADSQRDNASYDVNYTNSAGHRLIDYVDAMISVGELYGIPTCDLYRKSGINQLTLSTYTSDGLHFNSLGYIRIGNVIASSIQNMYSNEVATYSNNTDTESGGDITTGGTTEGDDSGSNESTDDAVTDENTVVVNGVSYDISEADSYAYKMIMKISNTYYMYVSNSPFYIYNDSTYNEVFYSADSVRAAVSSNKFTGFTSLSTYGTSLQNGYHYAPTTRVLSSYVWTNEDILYYGTDTVAVSASN